MVNPHVLEIRYIVAKNRDWRSVIEFLAQNVELSEDALILAAVVASHLTTADLFLSQLCAVQPILTLSSMLHF